MSCFAWICHAYCMFFFKQKTAYERRISDWSSDVCSSDLPINGKRDVPCFFLQTVTQARAILKELGRPNLKVQFDAYHAQIMEGDLTTLFRACVPDLEIGRESCRERVCQYE